MHYRNTIGWLAIGRGRSAGRLLAPCCRSVAAAQGRGSATAVMQVAESAAHSSRSDGIPQSSDLACPDLTAVGPGAPPPAATIAGADRLDLVAVSASAGLHSSSGVRPLPATIAGITRRPAREELALQSGARHSFQRPERRPSQDRHARRRQGQPACSREMGGQRARWSPSRRHSEVRPRQPDARGNRAADRARGRTAAALVPLAAEVRHS